MVKLLVLLLLTVALVIVAGHTVKTKRNGDRGLEELARKRVVRAPAAKETKRRTAVGANKKRRQRFKASSNGEGLRKKSAKISNNHKSSSKGGKKRKQNKKNKGKLTRDKPKKMKKTKKLDKKKKIGKIQREGGDQGSTCLATDCVDLAVSINELMRFKATNFQKQIKRILTKRSIGAKKSSKGNVFKSALTRLIVTGGNLSDPVCAGSTNNTGARQIANLSETLTNCETNITAHCDPKNMPSLNLTFIEACETSIEAFEAFIAKCSALSGAAACSCWSGDSSSAAVIDAVKKCDLGDLPKNTRYALEDCKSAFGICRKYEDDVADAVFACDQDAEILKKKLKNLSENKDAVSQVQTKISSLINSTRRQKREDNASTTAGFISLCVKVTTLISETPSSYLIAIYSASIVASSVTSFSDSDLSSLSTISAQMEVAVTVLDKEISTATSTIQGEIGKLLQTAFNN